jgi:uncharacterized membrane protein YidH (DUF202 family)
MGPLGDEGSAAGALTDIEDFDSDLSRERTLLAWNRTGVAFMALGGSVIKLTTVAGACILAMGALIWSIGYTQYKATGGTLRARGLDRSRMIRVIAWGTALVSMVALAIAVLQPGRPGL